MIVADPKFYAPTYFINNIVVDLTSDGFFDLTY